VIRNWLSGKHIDPCTLNCFVDGELHVGEEEKVRQHVKYCRPCALYVVSGKELKAAIARMGHRSAPRLPSRTAGAAEANPARRGNLVYIDSQPVLRAAVNQLQPTFREVLLLCDVEELSYRDIGLTLDIPINTVMSRISDARDALCQLLIMRHRKSR
jgi:Sigma-70, region 4